MDLSLTETQEMFKKVASDFVKAEAPAHQMTQWYRNKETFRPEIYHKAADRGRLGMLLPEQYGGAGASLTDCAVVFEELGRGPVPGPRPSSSNTTAQSVSEAPAPPYCSGNSMPSRPRSAAL